MPSNAKRRLENKTNDSDLISAIQKGETSYDVFRVLKAVCSQFSFDAFVVMKLPTDLEFLLDDLAILTNWNPEFIRAYDALELGKGSPVYAELRQTSLPVVWRMGITNEKRRDGKQNKVLELFKAFGHLNGVSIPVSDRKSSRGSVGFSGDRSDPEQHEIAELSFIATHVYDRLCVLSEPVHQSSQLLTDRERECVAWTSSGKTSNEIASIVGISENTVNHYLSAAAKKLNTVNKAHTVAQAIRLGLLN